jgi:RimJ/RimL family protein N-acetyltransferase
MPDRVVLQRDVVRLEPLELIHVDGLAAAATEDRATYAFTLVPDTTAAMREYVAGALDDERTGWALPFVIRLQAGDRIVGSTRFLDLDYWEEPNAWPPGRPTTVGQGTPSAGEIGSTWLAASAQRSQINTECKLLLLGHAFDEWQVHRITMKTDARNHRSRQAIERVGGRFEGIRRAHVPATDGSVRDSAYFSVIREEWPMIRRGLAARLARADG